MFSVASINEIDVNGSRKRFNRIYEKKLVDAYFRKSKRSIDLDLFSKSFSADRTFCLFRKNIFIIPHETLKTISRAIYTLSHHADTTEAGSSLAASIVLEEAGAGCSEKQESEIKSGNGMRNYFNIENN